MMAKLIDLVLSKKENGKNIGGPLVKDGFAMCNKGIATRSKDATTKGITSNKKRRS